MEKQTSHLCYADCSCEQCGKEIAKGQLIYIEEDTPFCSEYCADVYFDRVETPDEEYNEED